PGNLDSKLSPIIFKLLEPNRELRYQTAKQVIGDLRHLRSEQPAHTRRFRRLATIGTALIIAALMLQAIFRSPGNQRLSDGNRASTNKEANEYYERSLLYGGVGTDNRAQMRRMIERALELDPKFAAARAEYAFILRPDPHGRLQRSHAPVPSR